MRLDTAKSLLTKTIANWNEDNVPRLAAAFSFYAALSIAPVFVFAVTIGSLFLKQAGAEEALLRQVNGFIGNKETETLVKSIIESTHKKGTGTFATIVSFAVTFFSASNLFLQLSDAVNSIWGIKQTGSLIKNIIATRVLAFLMVATFGVLILAWLALDAWLNYLSDATSGFQGWPMISLIVTAAFFTGVLAIAYRGIPKGRTQWSDVWPGAIVAAIGLALSKLAFSAYLGYAGLSIYGAAGSIVALLLWIYYSSQIFFFGLEMTYTYTKDFGSLKGRNPGDLMYS